MAKRVGSVLCKNTEDLVGGMDGANVMHGPYLFS